MHRTRGTSGPFVSNGVKTVGNAFSTGIIPSVPEWSALLDMNVAQSGTWDIDLDDYMTSDTSVSYVVNTGALPTGITVNANGTFSGTVTDPSGSGSVTFTGTNSTGASGSGLLDWTIP